MTFVLHPQLEKDLILLGELELSKLMLVPDTDNPWVVLVPQVNGITELFQLDEMRQRKLLEEITKVSQFLNSEFKADKMNIGMLGNMVAQLHVHIICRFQGDKAWPDAIWGAPCEINESSLTEISQKIISHFNL